MLWDRNISDRFPFPENLMKTKKASTLNTCWILDDRQQEPMLTVMYESKSYKSHKSHQWKNIIPGFLHAGHYQHLGQCVQLFFEAQLQHLICLSQAKGKVGMLLDSSYLDNVILSLYSLFNAILASWIRETCLFWAKGAPVIGHVRLRMRDNH